MSSSSFKKSEELFFNLVKNIIISQNRKLFEELSKISGKDKEYFEHKYLKSEYYLPVMLPSPHPENNTIIKRP